MTHLALAALTAHRSWYVPGVPVTGDFRAVTTNLLVSEVEDSGQRVVLYRFPIGGHVQELRYDSLIDHRGNTLPSSIHHPVVIVVPRNDVSVALVGAPTNAFCQLVRTQYTASDGLVDLYIIELGRKGE